MGGEVHAFGGEIWHVGFSLLDKFTMGRILLAHHRWATVNDLAEISVWLTCQVQALSIMNALWLLLFLTIEDWILHYVDIGSIENYVVHQRSCLFAVCIMRRIHALVHLNVALLLQLRFFERHGLSLVFTLSCSLLALHRRVKVWRGRCCSICIRSVHRCWLWTQSELLKLFCCLFTTPSFVVGPFKQSLCPSWYIFSCNTRIFEGLFIVSSIERLPHVSAWLSSSYHLAWLCLILLSDHQHLAKLAIACYVFECQLIV